ncbi:uncharacterized protein EURHEDRAFT_519286 [Aspergillus ruber CBS 135680]|uniref:Shikimate dehydrogenase substrate binding N-terminal domain-containing protein n=1 Tax=Aspergillus ruber (strain CBS 135680) TaxID=1388766 RepID=A0A017S0U8_ASPRC|nr:uncharacterized protein EURHEDRAFT_519286 [Aspergillus ruber CBS 135680]EYE90259.1 hypothetical protein EURHEDRAFT_519286 [Aspergillus ruber CBS 135680]
MHKSIARSLGYNWRFLAKECPIVEDVIGLFRKPNSTGGVATMPYKTAIMAHLDGLDDYSVKVCACNNVYRVTDGSIRRLNNDWRGIKSWQTALIIGVGRARRAAVYALYEELGFTSVYVANRDEDEVRALRENTKPYGSSPQITHIRSVKEATNLTEMPYHTVRTVLDFEPQTSAELEARDILVTILPSSREKETGFQGAEIFYENLESAMKSHEEASPWNLLITAGEVENLCNAYGLIIIRLQPFLKIEKLKLWFQIVKTLGTYIIQMITNFLTENVTGDMVLIVQDMVEAADLGLGRIGTFDSVVRRVDRLNFGSCLDALNITGRVWTDPASITGTTPNSASDLKESIECLVRTVYVHRVFCIQVADAERMQLLLTQGHPFHERGGYLPVVDIARAVLKDLGYNG